MLSLNELDLVLVEGLRNEDFNKIECHQVELNNPLLFKADQSIVAVACDKHIKTDGLPLLDLNEIEKSSYFVFSLIKNEPLIPQSSKME